MISPAKRYVTVERPICGCGRTSAVLGILGGKRIGAEMVKKDKRADHASLCEGQDAADFEIAE